MTRAEAGEYLGLSRQRISQLVAAGKLEVVLIGLDELVVREDVERRKEESAPGGFHEPDSPHYTVAEAAGILGMTQSKLNRWIHDRKIESVRVGNRRLVLRSEVERVAAAVTA